jgi:hypothetical protein
MEHLYKTRRLQTTLYTQEGFYAGGTKAKEGDPIEAGVDKAFRDRIAQAKAKAQKSLDLGGYRNEAIERYRQVLARPNIYDSREQASSCLKKPFGEKGGG